MPDDDAIEITPVDVPLTQKQTGAEQDSSPRYWYQSKNTVIALAAALLLALVVIFVLPVFVSPVRETPVAVEVVNDAQVAGKLESPWQEAQLAKARREAQDILNRVLEKQGFLEKKSVNLWAGETFAEALETARLGDVAYRKRDFPEAISRYQAAEKQLATLEKSIPQRLKTALETGEQAIQAGDQELAIRQFELALLLEPGNQLAEQGLQRSAGMDKLLGLLEQARSASGQGNYQGAVEHYTQALALDGKNLEAQKGLETAHRQLAQQKFTKAMSRGFEALDSGNFSVASKAFAEAVAIHPHDEAANNALQQAHNRQAQQWLNSMLAQAAAQEQQEKWAEAVASYQKILDRDASIIDARVGKIRSQARADLDRQLQKFINQPERLSSDAVKNQARQVLSDARNIAGQGPVLVSQIQQVQELLKTSSTPVQVKIVSDQKTQVEIYKVGKLGQIASTTLELEPGRYVAVGMREGYRTVRVEFQVLPGRPGQAVEVICQEPV